MADDTLIRFPFSRMQGPNRDRPVNVLGESKLSKEVGPAGSGKTGHWCSECKGVWFGLGAEVECPTCGNRHG
ncbi:MAG: hypothetical protein CL955_10935 [Erythrobacteraceae bacterium]|nr:hypothetical protein [Erythrobacteraceae bacterium]